MKTVIIIVGAARSGSTLLSKALGGHSDCFTIGEINRFNNEINNDETHCGCSKKLKDCDFWNTNLAELESVHKSKIKGINSSFKVFIFSQLTKKNKIHKLILTILFKLQYKNKSVDNEIQNTFTLYNTIFERTNSKVLIDSTKGLFRALVLTSRAKDDIRFKFVQLTRDGRGVLNSGLKSSYSIKHNDGVVRKYEGKKDKNPSKIVNAWLYVNLRNFIILKLFNRSRTTFVRYEDFTANPSSVLTKIYKSVGLEYQERALKLGENENHILGGNSSRINAKEIRKQDDAWRKSLSSANLAKFNRKAKWLNSLIGY